MAGYAQQPWKHLSYIELYVFTYHYFDCTKEHFNYAVHTSNIISHRLSENISLHRNLEV